jgi:dihydrolipoamide dehydrogenase
MDMNMSADPVDLPDADVVVLGGGPGGYTAAFRAADLGRQVLLVDASATLGGVCLNVGCIPSKALLHAAKVITDAQAMQTHGIRFAPPEIDLAALRGFKDGVVGKLTRGLAGLARQRKVSVLRGRARFASPRHLLIETADGPRRLQFAHCIVAAGSSPIMPPGLALDDARVMDSTGALALADVPKRLLIVGGGIIGLEMATVYEALGSRVSVVEMANGLLPGADRDLVKVLEARLRKRCEAVLCGTRVCEVEALPEGLRVRFEGAAAPAEAQLYDRVLLAIGRRPNGHAIEAQAAGLEVDARGFIAVDKHCRTNVPGIYAIGDIAGAPMLAHKASREGRIAAENIAGLDSALDVQAIPSIAYTDPEVAWMGLTETQAQAEGIAYERGVFPWAASGRALGAGRDDGFTKLLVEPGTGRVLGAGIVGVHAGELLAEAVLALEQGLGIHEIAHAVHAHPTLSESVAMAAEIVDGSITDLFMPRRAAR